MNSKLHKPASAKPAPIERLFWHHSIISDNGGGYLKDAKGFSLGHFPSFLSAETFAKDNGYKISFADGGAK